MTLEQLDRTIFELIRLELVARGFLPSYAGILDSSGNLDPVLWKQAIDNFDPNNLVDLYGVGVPSNRSEKKGHRIVINRKARAKGQLGGNTPYFKPTGTEEEPTWDKKKKAMSSYHIPYEIRTVSGTVAMDRDLTSMLTDLFGAQCYLNLYNEAPNPSREFGSLEIFFTWEGSVDIKATEQLEQIHNYTFADAWIETDKTLRTGIVPITKITGEIKDLEGYDDRSVPSVGEVIIE